MPIARHFLDWSAPALPAAADWLAARFAADGTLDLSGTIVVLPGARAGRRLLELLVARAESAVLLLIPPTITTEHALPELLYEPKRPFASKLTQQLVWSEALAGLPPAQRRAFLPHPPPAGDRAAWLELGELLRGLHVELAADGLDVSQVLAAAAAIDGFAEHDRWQALAEVQRRYLQRLDELGLWDIQTARLVAIRQREPRTERQIVLVGMVDLNRVQRQLLDLVGEQVTALVVAPAALSDRFDAHGCVIPDQWKACELPIRDEHLCRVDGPADQAAAVTCWLASLAGKYRADQVVVGMPDERLASQIERQLAESDVPSRWVEAKRLAETGPLRLLKLVSQLADPLRFSDLAALVRHPDVFDWLLTRVDRIALAGGDPLTALDRFASEHVPATIDPERLERNEKLQSVAAILRAIHGLLAPVPAGTQSLLEWSATFRTLLVTVYGGRSLDRNQPADRFLIESLRAIHEALEEPRALPAALVPRVGLREAFQLVLAPLARQSLPPSAAANVVELLGWLELPLDDAPALIVTTFNDGFVPPSSNSDAFLPNRLRRQMGLLDNDRRYARDAYATSVLVHSRSVLRLVVPRRDVEGNPLSPSRLIFAADEETVTRRALKFFGELPPSPPRRNLLAKGKATRPVSLPPPPKPVRPKEKAETFSVTEFRAYLACPYRYYLQYVLRLESVADSQAELEPGAFGTLMHDVLQRFGRHDDAAEIRASTDPERIFGYLSDFLTTVAAARFGLKHCRPAVRVQIEQARTRLRALAEWQARRVQDGWQIVHGEETERHLITRFTLEPGTAVNLRGRIDRIDFHEASRTLAVLDYKTAEGGPKPHATHRRGDDWVDLQLPLYRHLIQAAQLPGIDCQSCRVELGYILAPKDVRQVELAMAAWSAEELAAADEVAREVIRKIQAGAFDDITSPPPGFCEDLAPITQDHRLGRWCDSGEGDAP